MQVQKGVTFALLVLWVQVNRGAERLRAQLPSRLAAKTCTKFPEECSTKLLHFPCEEPCWGSPTLKVTVSFFTWRGQLMLNEALLRARTKSIAFCAHTPFTALSCCFSMADDSPKGNLSVEGDQDSGPRSSAETAAGKSRGILLMLQGEVRWMFVLNAKHEKSSQQGQKKRQAQMFLQNRCILWYFIIFA